MKYAQIKAHRGEHPVRWMCSALEVSARGFYSWQGRAASPRRQFDQRLLTEIRASFAQSDQTYGGPRVWKDLRELAYTCGKKRVARIMRENGGSCRRGHAS